MTGKPVRKKLFEYDDNHKLFLLFNDYLTHVSGFTGRALSVNGETLRKIHNLCLYIDTLTTKKFRPLIPKSEFYLPNRASMEQFSLNENSPIFRLTRAVTDLQRLCQYISPSQLPPKLQAFHWVFIGDSEVGFDRTSLNYHPGLENAISDRLRQDLRVSKYWSPDILRQTCIYSYSDRNKLIENYNMDIIILIKLLNNVEVVKAQNARALNCEKHYSKMCALYKSIGQVDPECVVVYLELACPPIVSQDYQEKFTMLQKSRAEFFKDYQSKECFQDILGYSWHIKATSSIIPYCKVLLFFKSISPSKNTAVVNDLIWYYKQITNEETVASGTFGYLNMFPWINLAAHPEPERNCAQTCELIARFNAYEGFLNSPVLEKRGRTFGVNAG